MFSGRRPGKRSIVGTRVCVPYTAGFYCPGVISAIQTAGPWEAGGDRYVVQFDDGSKRTFDGDDIIGPGFQTVTKDRLVNGQKVFITHNGREVEGVVDTVEGDEVGVTLSDNNGRVMVAVRIDHVRLMKSRRSARLSESLLDSCTTECASEPTDKRCRPTEVAAPARTVLSRPHNLGAPIDSYMQSDDDCTWEDVADDVSMKDTEQRCLYQCMWQGCGCKFDSCDDVELHIQSEHLSTSEMLDAEEELYYTEITESRSSSSSSPSSTPCHDVTSMPQVTSGEMTFMSPTSTDHDYQKKENWSQPLSIDRRLVSSQSAGYSLPMTMSANSTLNHSTLSTGADITTRSLLLSPVKLAASRKSRTGDVRKCRKVYGVENRAMWCTQCKWKKACSRFSTDVR